MLKKYNQADIRRVVRRLRKQEPYQAPNLALSGAISRAVARAKAGQLGEYDPLYSIIDRYASPIDERNMVTMGDWVMKNHHFVLFALVSFGLGWWACKKKILF